MNTIRTLSLIAVAAFALNSNAFAFPGWNSAVALASATKAQIANLVPSKAAIYNAVTTTAAAIKTNKVKSAGIATAAVGTIALARYAYKNGLFGKAKAKIVKAFKAVKANPFKKAKTA